MSGGVKKNKNPALWRILRGSAAQVSQLHGVIPGRRLRNSLKILQSHVNKKHHRASFQPDSLINAFFFYTILLLIEWVSIVSCDMRWSSKAVYIVHAEYPHIWHARPTFGLECHPVKPYAPTLQHPTRGCSCYSTKQWDAPKTTFWSQSSCFSTWAEV